LQPDAKQQRAGAEERVRRLLLRDRKAKGGREKGVWANQKPRGVWALLLEKNTTTLW